MLSALRKITTNNIFWAFLLFPVAFAAFAAILTYQYFLPDISDKESLMNRNDTGIILLDRYQRPFFTLEDAKSKTFIPLDKIPQDVETALIASEDKDFYEHTGFSPKAILRALYRDLENKSLAYGGSTITQQLVKNSLLNQKKYFFRKYQEVILAAQIESRYTKDEILEMYLNSVYFGEGAFGVEEAAQRYFGKPAKDLTLAQSSFLIALLPAPSRLSPFTGNITETKTRQQLVLEKMLEEGYINDDQKKEAMEEKLTFNQDRDLNKLAPHFAMMVKEELQRQYSEEEIARSGFKVTTTLDLDWQQYSEEVVKSQVKLLNSNGATNAAVVVADPKTGEIKSLVGSFNWYDDKFGKVNVATSLRQPGSSFKPLYYAAALQKGIITPATILQDSTRDFGGGYKPKNYDGRTRGPVTVRRALSNSLNIPSVEVMSKLGIPTALEEAQKLGITTLNNPTNYGLSLALGAGEVKLVEMTAAYATLANYGQRTDLTTILQIQNKKGEIIYSHQPHPQKVLNPGAAFLISSILSDNGARNEVFGNSLNISRPAAVKTGTTENYKDAWTLGYTPSLVVGVWVGNNDGKSMDGIAGSLGAAPIWKSLMEKFLAGTPIENFQPPQEVSQASLCLGKGASLPAEATRSAQAKEYFLTGTQPNFYCTSSTPTSLPSPTPTTIPTNTPTPNLSPTEPEPSNTPLPNISFYNPNFEDSPQKPEKTPSKNKKNLLDPFLFFNFNYP